MFVDHKCPKCSGEMEMGFLRDRVGARPFRTVSHMIEWFAGLPEPLWDGSMKTKGKTRFRVDVLRCKDCGYLEHYARKPLIDLN